VGGGLVGGELVVEGGEIRGLRVDNGGGEGGVTGGEEGPDAKRYQHAVLFPFMYKGAAGAYVQCSSPEKNEEERKSIHGKNYPQICEGSK